MCGFWASSVIKVLMEYLFTIGIFSANCFFFPFGCVCMLVFFIGIVLEGEMCLLDLCFVTFFIFFYLVLFIFLSVMLSLSVYFHVIKCVVIGDWFWFTFCFAMVISYFAVFFHDVIWSLDIYWSSESGMWNHFIVAKSNGRASLIFVILLIDVLCSIWIV